jgi:hypothetical protein
MIGPPMPIPAYRQLSDHDAEAIAAYLRSLKPVKNALTRSQYKTTELRAADYTCRGAGDHQ